jgi:hypothetical protein
MSISDQSWLDAFSYDPITGVVSWKKSRFHSRVGKQAGRTNKVVGYRYLSLTENGRTVERLEHRVVWLLMTGSWPEQEVDHVNRDRLDNRWKNLREASRRDNMANSRRPNRSGLRGAFCGSNGKFYSQVVRAGVTHYLGTFDCALDAHLAYVAAAKNIHGEFASDGH